ncbi:MAG: type II toxin-antitoxin system VapC family toxin [Microbacteriaceae bacterium]|nr:type II toxin-antitoxin system VapC family toxin [Microbacteriaceae bacterium]
MTSGYLLDTSVLSALAPGRPDRGGVLSSWLLVTLPRLHVSTITVFEIVQGIGKLRRTGAVSRADANAEWLEASLARFGDRVLPVDTDVARRAGRLADWAVGRGVNPGAPDVIIAATAVVHDLTLLTYNLKHFAPLEIGAIDPTADLPR